MTLSDLTIFVPLLADDTVLRGPDVTLQMLPRWSYRLGAWEVAVVTVLTLVARECGPCCGIVGVTLLARTVSLFWACITPVMIVAICR